MKYRTLFIAAAVLFWGGIVGSLANLLPIYNVVNEVDAKTADMRLDRAAVIADICAFAILVGFVLFMLWLVLLIRGPVKKPHAKTAK